MQGLKERIHQRWLWYTDLKSIGALATCFALGCAISWGNLTPIYFKIAVGKSMEPALRDGEVLVVCRLCTPRRGDIVLVSNAPPLREKTEAVWSKFGLPREEVSVFIKRVHALKGEPVPPYSADQWSKYHIPVSVSVLQKALAPTPSAVPDRYVWVLGDNWINSIDSRFWGPVPLTLLQGSVVFSSTL